MIDLDLVQKNADATEQKLFAAVVEAGDILLKLWPGNKQNTQDLEVENKADGSQVTKADFASNEILLKALAELYPEDEICSEEVGFVNDNNAERVWYVDPLDGTSNFIRGEDDFLVLLGLCQAGRPITGIAYFPARGEFCFAAAGRGAYSSKSGRLSVNEESNLQPEKINIRGGDWGTKGYQTTYHTGAAQHLIASGTMQACAYKVSETKSPKAWDFVPFECIINESGGRVSDENGAEIIYSGEAFTAQYYLASNKTLHEQFLKVLNA